MIPLFRPDCGKAELAEISRAFKRGWIGLGPMVEEFESALSQRMGGRRVVTLSSCTWALDHMLKLFGAVGRRVLVPSLTYIASTHPLLYNGCTPVWVDVKPDTLCMDPVDLAGKIRRGDAAVIPVHYGGNLCDMDAIIRIAHEKGAKVIEDAAHAFGAEYHGRQVGSFGDAAVFSFHATKAVTAGDGGAVSLADNAVADRLMKMRSLGVSESTWDRLRHRSSSYWDFSCEEVGYKTYLNDIAASVALAQLRRFPRALARRRTLTARYIRSLGDIPRIKFLRAETGCKPSCHHFVVKAERRDALLQHLYRRGITAGVHYRPVHHHPLYRRFPADVPVTEEVFEKIITLPLYPRMTPAEQERVITAVRGFYDL